MSALGRCMDSRHTMPDDRTFVAATGPGGLSVSSDGGETWRVMTDAELWTVAPHPDGGFVAAGRGGVVARIEL